MKQVDDRRLALLVRGELSSAEEAVLQKRLELEPGLRNEYERMMLAWSDLELPEPAPAPVAFAERIRARAQEGTSTDLSWSRAPGWARVAAALALVTGLALGVAVSDQSESVPDFLGELTLAEEYVLAVEEIEELEEIEGNGDGES